jgi:lipoprotein-anchoring transpeptidase ErfK/SrfK
MKNRLLPLVFSAAVASATATLNTAHANGETVLIRESFKPGTIVVRTKERALYYVTGTGQAIRYPVGVGRSGKQWSGSA